MLKRHVLLRMLFYTLVVLPGSAAFAADTNINITGTVIAAACTVDSQLINGQEVNLGAVGRTKFQYAGDGGDWKSFTLSLSNCPAGTSKSTVTFTGTPDGNDPTLFANAEPVATAATNIAVQMVDGNNHASVISNNGSMTVDVSVSTKTVTFPLAARLYTPIGGVQAGKVNAIVLVNFTYQ